MSILYSKSTDGIVEIDHDPDSKELYTLVFRPETFSSGKEVIANTIILAPTVPNGCMYSCLQGGITASEPVWSTVNGSKNPSGNTIWKCIPYNLLLKTGESIQTNVVETWPAYQFILPVGVTVDNTSLIDSSIVQFRVTSTPLTGIIPITLRISVLHTNGIYSSEDITINLNLTQM
jgi:hypothetical protein